MFITLKETKICLIMPVLPLICYVCSRKKLLSPHIFDDSASKESACNVGDLGSIPGLGRSPGEGDSYPAHSTIVALRIPWTEEPGGLQSTGLQTVGHD